MTTVAQAYFHIRQVRLDDTRLRGLGDLASSLSAEAASGLYPPDSVIEVRLSEGSLKGWITVGGIAIAAYGVIADYKGFKESILELNSDAKIFSEIVIQKFIEKSDLGGGQVYRQGRRTKTPGRIKRLIERRERLNEHRSELSKSIIDRENIEIEMLLQEILTEVDPSERAIVRKLLGESQLPDLPTDTARIAITSPRHEQLSMIDERGATELEPLADYIHRFRLSDGPSPSPSPKLRGGLLGGSNPELGAAGTLTARDPK